MTHRIDINRETLQDLYWNKKMSLRKMAKELGCTAQCLVKKMDDYKISRRNLSHARSLRVPPSEETKQKTSESMKEYCDDKKGEKHHAWKGGKYNCNGYIRTYKPDHPNCDKDGHVLEHRLVMEEQLGRLLKPEEIVHHINGITDDNRPENLLLFTNVAAHIAFHKQHNINIDECL